MVSGAQLVHIRSSVHISQDLQINMSQLPGTLPAIPVCVHLLPRRIQASHSIISSALDTAPPSEILLQFPFSKTFC